MSPTIWYRQLDSRRRQYGQQLEQAGFGPRSCPSRVLWQRPGVCLRSYGGEGAALVLLPAPIKAAYIWDLAEDASVVRRALEAGFRVYRVDWQHPSSAQQSLGLDDYADAFILQCLDTIAVVDGRSAPVLIGHSLGGTFAAIFASLYPKRLQGLVLVEAPLEFTVGGGPLARFAGRMHLSRDAMGNVPGSLIDAAALAAAPMAFMGERWLDGYLSLADPRASRLHMQVMRWAYDEAPMSGRLFDEVVTSLYRDDCFMRGCLSISGRAARPAAVTAPLLSILNPNSGLIPPASMLRFHEAVSSAEKRVLAYRAEVGVFLQHVGPLVGRRAQRELWPEAFRWLSARATEGMPLKPQTARKAE